MVWLRGPGASCGVWAITLLIGAAVVPALDRYNVDRPTRQLVDVPRSSGTGSSDGGALSSFFEDAAWWDGFRETLSRSRPALAWTPPLAGQPDPSALSPLAPAIRDTGDALTQVTWTGIEGPLPERTMLDLQIGDDDLRRFRMEDLPQDLFATWVRDTDEVRVQVIRDRGLGFYIFSSRYEPHTQQGRISVGELRRGQSLSAPLLGDRDEQAIVSLALRPVSPNANSGRDSISISAEEIRIGWTTTDAVSYDGLDAVDHLVLHSDDPVTYAVVVGDRALRGYVQAVSSSNDSAVGRHAEGLPLFAVAAGAYASIAFQIVAPEPGDTIEYSIRSASGDAADAKELILWIIGRDLPYVRLGGMPLSGDNLERVMHWLFESFDVSLEVSEVDALIAADESLAPYRDVLTSLTR